jgi:hypothetical protein
MYICWGLWLRCISLVWFISSREFSVSFGWVVASSAIAYISYVSCLWWVRTWPTSQYVWFVVSSALAYVSVCVWWVRPWPTSQCLICCEFGLGLHLSVRLVSSALAYVSVCLISCEFGLGLHLSVCVLCVSCVSFMCLLCVSYVSLVNLMRVRSRVARVWPHVVLLFFLLWQTWSFDCFLLCGPMMFLIVDICVEKPVLAVVFGS